jgi:predicted peroxiredoxin
MAMPRTITLAERRRAYATLVVGYGVAAAVMSTGVVLWLTIQAVHFL